MLERAEDAGDKPRAALRIGGRSIARQQLDLALAMQCERIVCIAPVLDPELLKLQHVAEAAGARFHVVVGPRALAGLITATDEIVAISDGLFVSAGEALVLLGKGQSVLVQAIEPGLAAGFERIDMNTAAAGAMRVPGRLVAQLAELPSDCDAVSALQRIALQSGVAQRHIPASGADGLIWTLVRSDAEAHALEPQWVRQRTDNAGRSLTPGRWLALAAVRRFGAALLDSGRGATSVLLGTLALVGLGLGAGWFGYPVIGFALCGFAWISMVAFAFLERIESDEAIVPEQTSSRGVMLGWLIDAVLVALAGWSAVVTPGEAPQNRYFPPLILVGLLRLVPKTLATRWTAWLEDRALIAVLIATGIAAGYGSELLQTAALVIAITGILVPRGDFRLTRP